MTIRAKQRTASNPWGGPQIGPAAQDPYAAISAAVLTQAGRDAKSGCLDAILFLASDDSEIFAELVGLDHTKVARLGTSLLIKTTPAKLHFSEAWLYDITRDS